MPGQEESLFSLELVVEKLYIPHVTCRFPAIAFRLLDFPTILIPHVESELSTKIKTKISRDPYYETPDQFSELKDNHGNFMIRKGKSCLFKIPVENLKMHLTNTPLYVMVIDEYPEKPKLLGNSTVPLNSLMDSICVDIAKLGTSVPSVQGDKGLFKIYSLMGKEIGYFVLGFRLLCLGPGLIPHLPAAALTKRIMVQPYSGDEEVRKIDVKSDGMMKQEIQHAQQSVQQQYQAKVNLNDSREVGSMTDVEKQDVILQTMDFNDKAVHVAISEAKPHIVTASTQTERRKRAKQTRNEQQKIVENIDEEESEDVTNNIICPPPLFYNSECNPKVKMQKMLHYDCKTSSVFSDDMTIEDLEDVEETHQHIQERGDVSSNKIPDKKKIQSRPVISSQQTKNAKTLLTGGRGDGVFPVLTALLNELTGIQNSQLLEAVAKVNRAKQSQPTSNVSMQQKQTEQRPTSKRLEELSRPRFSRQMIEKDDAELKVVGQGGEAVTYSDRKVRQCAQQPEMVPKNKGWLRQRPQQNVNKSPLTFGLTHTQRLRLAKTNPEWLKRIEKEEAEKKRKQEQMKAVTTGDHDSDLNVTNLSDTLTEVRRLAQRALEKGDQTMDTTAGVSTVPSEEEEVRAGPRRSGSPSRGKKWLSRYGKRSPSPKQNRRSPSKDGKSLKKSGQMQNGNDRKRKEDVNLGIQRTGSAETEETSQRSDVPSQKSIEVHLPSAQMDEDDDEDSDVTLEDIPEDKAEESDNKFPGFGSHHDESFPESIEGHQPNESLSETRDSDQPLESTRLSNGERRARVRQSADSDTRQFMSTDEPELQGLMSDEEDRSDIVDDGRHGRLSGALVSASIASSVHKFPVVNPVVSEQSPVPANRRSAVKLDFGPNRELTPQPDTPRSQGSSKRPTPRPRRPTRLARESINTDSVSSYQPSDADNVLVLLSSDANYSDDFHHGGSEIDDSLTDISSPDFVKPKFIPSTKLGYTIS